MHAVLYATAQWLSNREGGRSTICLNCAPSGQPLPQPRAAPGLEAPQRAAEPGGHRQDWRRGLQPVRGQGFIRHVLCKPSSSGQSLLANLLPAAHVFMSVAAGAIQSTPPSLASLLPSLLHSMMSRTHLSLGGAWGTYDWAAPEASAALLLCVPAGVDAAVSWNAADVWC